MSSTWKSSSDRVEIQELLARYAWALHDRDWDAFRATFTADAHVDYSTAGGVVGSPADAAAWLATTLGGFELGISQVSNAVIEPVGDDRATVRSMYRMVMKVAGDPPMYLEASGEYRDTVVRTDDGWRIADRFEQMRYLRS